MCSPDDDEVHQPRRQPRHDDGGQRVRLGEQQVVDRHPVLRSTFSWDGPRRPLQLTHRDVPVAFRRLDWTEAPADELEHDRRKVRDRIGDLSKEIDEVTEQLEAVFERFRQVDASDRREKGGTGLGLAISRAIVQQHGGRIWAESESGAGATHGFRDNQLVIDQQHHRTVFAG